jgi:hypothetical protein
MSKRDMSSQHLAQFGWIELTPVDQPSNELRLHKGMPPVTPAATWSNASLMEGGNSSLEAGIVAAVRYVVVTAMGELTLCSQETLFGLDQIELRQFTHND